MTKLQWTAPGLQSTGHKTVRGESPKTILGRNFITPDEVTQRFGWQYSNTQQAELYAMLADDDRIRQLATRGYGLMPKPPRELDFKEMLHLLTPASESQPVDFVERQVLSPGGWLAVWCNGWSSSFAAAPLPVVRALSMMEVIYGASVYQALRGQNLLGANHIATSTVLRGGCYAHVANPNGASFRITGIWGNDRWDYLRGFVL